jgi:hypothetical protein
VFCVDLDTTKPFDGYCFGHALSKVCQYVTSKEVARGLSYASIKSTQVDIQKCITWLKKLSKGQQAWEKVCVDSGLNPCKLNTHEHPYEDEIHGNFPFLFLFLGLVDYFINIYFSNTNLLYFQKGFFQTWFLIKEFNTHIFEWLFCEKKFRR